MEETPLSRKRLAIGLAATVLGAAGLYTALPASAEHVAPTEVPGNADCPEGTTEFKIESPDDVEGAGDGTLSVDVDVRDTEEGQVFDWESNIGVDVVIVKGGDNSNVYTYSPESTGDTGLHAPENASGDYADLSHISFCYDTGDDTTTTTAMETTTTTVMDTTTTTAPTTDTTAPTTATTKPAGPKAPVAPVAKPVTGQPTYTG